MNEFKTREEKLNYLEQTGITMVDIKKISNNVLVGENILTDVLYESLIIGVVKPVKQLTK